MTNNPTFPLRIWRTGPWSGNGLMRASDRFEACVRVLAVAAALTAVPLAGAAGTAGYTSTATRVAAEDAAKTLVAGTVTSKPERAAQASRVADTLAAAEADVRWTRDGRPAEARIVVPDSAVLGSEVPVWLAPDGKPTVEPRQPGTAAASGISTGLGVLLGIWGGALILVVLVDWLVERYRAANLDREWRLVAHQTGREFS